MTRDESIQRHSKRLQETLALQKKRLHLLETQRHYIAERGNNRRRYYIGALADEAGLFTWTDAQLQWLFQAVVHYGDVETVLAHLHAALPSFPSRTFDPWRDRGNFGSCQSNEGIPVREPLPRPVPEFMESGMENENDGAVYVIQMTGHPFLKIGHVTYGGRQAVQKRLASFQTGCPQPLKILKIYFWHAAARLELLLHAHLASSRQTGEWFATELATIDDTIRTLVFPAWKQSQEGK